MNQLPEYKLLGIDPGTNLLGYAIIDVFQLDVKLIEIGTINLSKLESHTIKLLHIHKHLNELIDKFNPKQLAIEAPFYGKNVQSMLKLGRAQGVAIAAAMSRGLTVEEYSPKKIKQSITGNGNATKEQVAAMLARMFTIPPEQMTSLDASDALATVVCHYHQNKTLQTNTSKFSSWANFASANPNKVK